MRRDRNVLNESFNDSLLDTIFRINQNDHTNIKGESEKPLSPDGAKFALSFPLPWDKLTSRNMDFYGDSMFVAEVPKTSRLNDKYSGDNSLTDEGKGVKSKYNIQSYVDNADYRKKIIAEIRNAKSDFNAACKEYGFPSKSEQGTVSRLISGSNTGFLDLLTSAKENRYFDDSDYKLLKEWKKILGYPFVVSLKKTTVDLIDNLISEYISEEIERNAENPRNNGKHKFKTGVNQAVLLGNNYLDRYNDIRQIGKVPVEEFIEKATDTLKKVTKNATVYEYAKKALEEANVRRIEVESKTYDKEIVVDYMFTRSIIHYYNLIRRDQHHKYPELGYVSKKDSEGKTWTVKDINEEVVALKGLYKELLKDIRNTKPSDVVNILGALQRMNSFGVREGGDRTELGDKITSLVSKMGDPSLLRRSGDVGLAIFMGADLKIRYVISSVCVDMSNYNMVGTYDSTRKYVYGWSLNKRLTTVADDALRKLNGMKDTEDVINFNQIPVTEIEKDNKVHCVLFIHGSSDTQKVKPTDDDMTKFILGNIAGVEINVSQKSKKTEEGDRKVYKIESKDDSKSLYSIKETLTAEGIPFEVAKGNDDKEYITIDKKYNREIIELAKRAKVGSAFLNTLFNDLDEKREEYNIFLPNLMSDMEFATEYYTLFTKYNDDKKISKNREVLKIVDSIGSMLRDPKLFDADRYDEDMLKTIENVDSKRILADFLVTDKVNTLIQGKGLQTVVPISAMMKKEIIDIVHEINTILKQQDIPVQIDDIDIDEYKTLGQMIRARAAKERYREENNRWLTDKERYNKYRKSQGSYNYAESRVSDKDNKDIEVLHEKVRSSLADYSALKLSIGSDNVDATKLIQMADPSFVKMDKIRDSVNDVVSDAMSSIFSDVTDIGEQREALGYVLSYISENIKTLSKINENVGKVNGENKEDRINKKVDVLKRYLVYMKGLTRKLRNVLQRGYGIRLIASGPGE